MVPATARLMIWCATANCMMYLDHKMWTGIYKRNTQKVECIPFHWNVSLSLCTKPFESETMFSVIRYELVTNLRRSIVNYMVSVTIKDVTEIDTLHLTTVSCHTNTGIFRSVVINDDLGMWAWRIYIATNNLVDVSVYNDDDMAKYIYPKWHIKICIAVESTGIMYPKYVRLNYQLVDRTSAGCQVPIG